MLIFSTCRRTRVPLKTRGQNEVEKIGCEQQNSWVYHATRDEVDQAWDYGQPSQDWSSLDIEAEYNAQSWGSDQEHDRPGMQPISDMGQLATSTPTSSQYSNSSAHSLCSARNSSQPSTKIMPQYKFVPHDVNFENVLRMMSDSLSIVICDRRPRKSGGIVLSNDTGFPRLDTISPVLFSPGYLRVGPGGKHVHLATDMLMLMFPSRHSHLVMIYCPI